MQDSGNISVIDQLRFLTDEQSRGDEVYPQGIFPSQRYHPVLPYQREDDNLFFTASIVHILQQLQDALTHDERELTNIIIIAATSAYALFRNKDGLDTYNFWKTHPSRHFPNGLLMHRFEHFRIPDDVDDTALVFLTENASKERVLTLREKLKKHANLAYKQAFNPMPKYHHLRCYSTFFGKRMYIEFDVCVLSNLMRLILQHFNSSDLNEYDHAALEFVTEVICSGEHRSHPFYSAPNYPTTDLILYHVARLLPLLPEPYKGRVESIVRKDIRDRLKTAHGMDRVIIENSAMKLGIEISADRTPISIESEHGNDFYFFHAGMITAFENRVAQRYAANPLFHLRYKSKALERALLIENMVLSRKLSG
jgi:hypothetical protein